MTRDHLRTLKSFTLWGQRLFYYAALLNLKALDLLKNGTNLPSNIVVDLITRPQRPTFDKSESCSSDSALLSDHSAPVDVDVIDVATRVAMASLHCPFYLSFIMYYFCLEKATFPQIRL